MTLSVSIISRNVLQKSVAESSNIQHIAWNYCIKCVLNMILHSIFLFAYLAFINEILSHAKRTCSFSANIGLSYSLMQITFVHFRIPAICTLGAWEIWAETCCHDDGPHQCMLGSRKWGTSGQELDVLDWESCRTSLYWHQIDKNNGPNVWRQSRWMHILWRFALLMHLIKGCFSLYWNIFKMIWWNMTILIWLKDTVQDRKNISKVKFFAHIHGMRLTAPWDISFFRKELSLYMLHNMKLYSLCFLSVTKSVCTCEVLSHTTIFLWWTRKKNCSIKSVTTFFSVIPYTLYILRVHVTPHCCVSGCGTICTRKPYGLPDQHIRLSR